MKKMINKIKNEASKDIVVIGDLMLDEYVMGEVSRISPEAPVPVLKEQSREFSFGGATNVAANCAHVGCNVHIIGLLGRGDSAGEKLLSMLAEKKIFVDGIVLSSERLTTRKKRIVSNNQQLLRIDTEETKLLSVQERDRLVCNIHSIIKNDSVVLISDYSKGVIDREIVKEILICAEACNAVVIADPKGPNFDKYKGVHYIKPNLKEFNQMVDCFGLKKTDSLIDNGRRICEKLQLSGLIVTLGEKGLQFVSHDREIFVKACKREVYDITGAGDTVLAFLAVGFSHSFPIEESIRLANAAAAISVSHHKTYSVGLDELYSFESGEKVFYDWSALKSELERVRLEKKKIVFTNGCFDLLHKGHIFLLNEAKKRGDILVVALNTDESVSRYKGPGRPIKDLSERATIMSAIGVVDYVVTFDQDTPKELIEFLKPDVLIKGGDYKVETIAGYDFVRSYGGEVDVVDYQQGFSTSNIVKSLSIRGS